ncbi:MAG: hypothetical protein MPJ24_03295 [Pirellulaceae bacterium]|nr:hypothetical protein [Pirellulaceae bacterium]
MKANNASGFFVYHVEKILLALLVASIGYGLFVGTGVSDKPQNTEAEATALANAALEHIAENDTTSLIEEKSEGLDLSTETLSAKPKIDIELAYTSASALHPMYFKPKSLRKDPLLLPLRQLEVTPAHSLIAIKKEDGFGAEKEPFESYIKKERPKKTNTGRDQGAVGGGQDTDTSRKQDEKVPVVPRELSSEHKKRLEVVLPLGETVFKREYQHFAVLKGIVELKKQQELFKEGFEGALGFSSLRDIPQYCAFEVERAEWEGGAWGPWGQIDTSKDTSIREQFAFSLLGYEGEAPFRHPTLTDPLPPVLGYDQEVFSHSEIRRLGNSYTFMEKHLKDMDKTARGQGGDIVGGEEGKGAGAAGGGGAAGGAGGGREERQSSRAQKPKVLPNQKAEFLQFRFVDYSVEEGKKYRYRVRLGVVDPNNPYTGVTNEIEGVLASLPPMRESLHAEVLKRLSEVSNENEMPYCRWTQWSVESPEVDFTKSSSGRVYVGGGKNNLGLVIKKTDGEERLPKPGEVPTINLAVGSIEEKLALNVFSQDDFPIGSWVTIFSKELEILDPASLTFYTVEKERRGEDFKLSTDCLVLDLLGGNELEKWTDVEEEVSETGYVEMLYLDSNGNIQVRNQLTDSRSFYDNRFVDPAQEDKDKKASERNQQNQSRGEGGGSIR